jgi:hypothetical protein
MNEILLGRLLIKLTLIMIEESTLRPLLCLADLRLHTILRLIRYLLVSALTVLQLSHKDDPKVTGKVLD